METLEQMLKAELQNSPGGMPPSDRILQFLQSGNPKYLRPMTLLKKDEWKALDDVVLAVSRRELRLASDLRDAGLVYPVRNALGTTLIEWERMGDMNGAEVNMTGLSDSPNDRVEFDYTGMPLPIIHKDFFLHLRTLEASRNRGSNLDTVQLTVATRKVAEQVETMIMDGYSAINVGGYTIYGYTSHPKRNTGSISNWADANTAPLTIFNNTQSMITALQADEFRGPYVMYVPDDFWTRLQADYYLGSASGTPMRTILNRLLDIPELQAIRPSGYLSGGAQGEIVLVQLQNDVIDLVTGMEPTVIQWSEHAGFTARFKVMAILVPRVRSDKLDRCGIAHYSV